MDIKLKNSKMKTNNSGGIFLMFLIIAGAVAGCILSYPWLREIMSIEDWQNIGYINEGIGDIYHFTLKEVDYYTKNYWQARGMMELILFGSTAFIVAGALVIALIRPFHMVEKGIFKAPFEIVGAAIFFVLVFILDNGYSFADLICFTVTGELAQEIAAQFFLTSTQAEGVVLTFHILIWGLYFFFVYWGVTCLSAVFVTGPLSYIKERTITGRIICFCKRWLQKTFDLVQSIDLKDNPTRIILKIVGINFLLLTVISCFWFYGIFGLMVYSVILFMILKKNFYSMQEKYQVLLGATNQLAEGNLDVEINEDLGVFEPFRGEIQKIQSGFKKAVEQEVKSQSMKTELVTNVSHDLKTPLTAIITYVNLLKKEGITEEERKNYITVLDQKSMRLKSLIEDLFEISKANSRNVTLNLIEVDIVSLMKQARLELDDKIQESQVDFRWNLPEEKLPLILDSEKTYRIFENLLVNITKYAMPGTRAYIDMAKQDGKVCISMKNISATEISLDGSEITERFIRGDASRNTEGSGLGLAIAKSFTELQKGSMEVEIEADLFKVVLTWNISVQEEELQFCDNNNTGSEPLPSIQTEPPSKFPHIPRKWRIGKKRREPASGTRKQWLKPWG